MTTKNPVFRPNRRLCDPWRKIRNRLGQLWKGNILPHFGQCIPPATCYNQASFLYYWKSGWLWTFIWNGVCRDGWMVLGELIRRVSQVGIRTKRIVGVKNPKTIITNNILGWLGDAAAQCLADTIAKCGGFVLAGRAHEHVEWTLLLRLPTIIQTDKQGCLTSHSQRVGLSKKRCGHTLSQQLICLNLKKKTNKRLK